MATDATTWDVVMPLIVRGLVNDLIEPYNYSEEKVQQLIVTCAQLVKPELDFTNSYTIDIPNMTITPDPVISYDDGFTNLVSMKTATLILQGEVKNLAANSIRVTDAGATIDMTDAFKATKVLYEQMLEDYQRAKIAYVCGNQGYLKAILSPYTVFYFSYNYTNIPNNISFG